MKKRLFMVDYRKNGISMHECLEITQIGNTEDADMVRSCHVAVGLDVKLDSVIEVYADMTAEELDRIALSPESLTLPRRVLYVDVEEANRIGELLKGAIV